MVEEKDNICRMCGYSIFPYIGTRLKSDHCYEDKTEICIPCFNELDSLCSLFNRIAKQEDFSLRKEVVEECITEWITYSSIFRHRNRRIITELRDKIKKLEAKISCNQEK